MSIISYYCRKCQDFSPHAIIDQNLDNPRNDYSKRVEMANPEE